MRSIIDQYRRPILAVFGIVLMIVFILPPTLKSGADARNNPVIGHVGKEAVHARDNALAEHQWERVLRQVFVRTGMPQQPWAPIVAAYLDPAAITAINDHKQAYFLLLKEAEQRGVTVNPAEVSEILNSPGVGIADRANGRLIAYSDMTDPEEAEAIRDAVTRLLVVRNSFQVAQDTIKISQPVRRQLIAQNFQTVNLQVVDVPGSQFTPAAPTTQALDAQFKQYADVNPEDGDKSPHGYGYRFPDRVKLQSIEVPIAAIRATAEAARNKDAAAQYEWDREAYKFYAANQSLFPTTAPAASTAPAKPTTRPFAEAKEDARQAVLENDIAKLSQRIVERVSSQITGDYLAYRNALAAGDGKGQVPNSSVGVPYNSYEYLQQVAADAQKNFGVLPVVNAYDSRFLTAQDLINLPGLGRTYVENQPFAGYVLTHAAAFSAEKDDSKTLENFEPSPTIHDELGNAFVFRLSDAQAAHAPASLQDVATAVEQDLRNKSTFEQAKKVADELLAQAKKTGSLQAAASAAGRNVIPLKDVRFNDPTALLPLHLSGPVAQRDFLRQVFELMSTSSKDNAHPMGVIELPRDGRALVVQVADVHTDLTADDLRILEAQAGVQAAGQLAHPLVVDWFNYDSIVSRLNFQPTANNEQSRPVTPSNAPPAGQPLL